jgi:hypothetical protein
MEGAGGPSGQAGGDLVKRLFKSKGWGGAVRHPSPTVKIRAIRLSRSRHAASGHQYNNLIFKGLFLYPEVAEAILHGMNIAWIFA